MSKRLRVLVDEQEYQEIQAAARSQRMTDWARMSTEMAIRLVKAFGSTTETWIRPFSKLESA